MARQILPLRSALAALVVVVAVGGVVLAGGAVRPSVGTADQDAYVQSSAIKYLSASAGVRTNIVSVTLPPGSWILTAEATLVTFGEGQVVRCGVFAGSQVLQQTARDHDADADEISAVGAVKRTSGFVASFKCWQDGGVSGRRNYLDPGAALWAHKSSSLAF
jgi:hypothetical protein